jgi:hypothetical protein
MSKLVVIAALSVGPISMSLANTCDSMQNEVCTKQMLTAAEEYVWQVTTKNKVVDFSEMLLVDPVQSNNVAVEKSDQSSIEMSREDRATLGKKILILLWIVLPLFVLMYRHERKRITNETK